MSKVKRFILHTSYFILLLTSVFWLLTPAFAQTVSYPVANLNNIRYVSAFAGATAGAKIAACLADLPASGGVCDARGLPGAQTISADPFLGMSPPIQPTPSSVAGGALAQTIYNVEVTYVGGPKGETAPSGEYGNFTVLANHLLTVNCPSTSSYPGGSTSSYTGCNIYVAVTPSGDEGGETLQAGGSIAIGATWTGPA